MRESRLIVGTQDPDVGPYEAIGLGSLIVYAEWSRIA